MTGPGSYQITCFALGACVHEILCAPTKTEVSIFPSPVGLLLLGPAGLAIFLVPDPWAGTPNMWLELLTPQEKSPPV